jgi:hypothetical protein
MFIAEKGSSHQDGDLFIACSGSPHSPLHRCVRSRCRAHTEYLAVCANGAHTEPAASSIPHSTVQAHVYRRITGSFQVRV